MNIHASAKAMECSKSLARRRHQFSHAKVRSTTHLRGSRTKPLALSERLTISSVNLPTFLVSVRSGCSAADGVGLAVSALDSGHYGVPGGAAGEAALV
jgi:hypothetical protein